MEMWFRDARLWNGIDENKKMFHGFLVLRTNWTSRRHTVCTIFCFDMHIFCQWLALLVVFCNICNILKKPSSSYRVYPRGFNFRSVKQQKTVQQSTLLPHQFRFQLNYQSIKITAYAEVHQIFCFNLRHLLINYSATMIYCSGEETLASLLICLIQ